MREGDTLAGRYRLAARLGSGGMSEVWLAEDGELDRSVAVKLLAPTADRVRFEREAQAYAACGHSNVACVFDYGEIEDRPYIVLEHLPGGTLEDRLDDASPLADGDTLVIATQVASGMAHAHSRGLVHRDLKPENILFDAEGRAKLADFGIAHTTEASTLTEAGTILGTAAYASPEQATDQAVTPASDVYSFGVILFRMLTGTLPFTAESPMELLLQHARAEPPPVSRFRADAPPRLAALTAAALAKDPGRRPGGGGALHAALTSATGGTNATAPTQVLRAPRWPPRRRTAVIGGAAALGLLLPIGFAAAVFAVGANSGDPSRVPAGTRARAQPTAEPRLQTGAAQAPNPTTASESSVTSDQEGERSQPTATARTTPAAETADPTTAQSTGPTTQPEATSTATTATTGTTTSTP